MPSISAAGSLVGTVGPHRMFMRLSYSCVVVIGLALGGCASPDLNTQEQLRAGLKRIKVDGGVSAYGAEVIAKCYFYRYIHWEGHVGEVVDDGGAFWAVGVYRGYWPTLMKDPIRIEKATGRVSCVGFPTVDDPRSML